jgi:hypothetical protein
MKAGDRACCVHAHRKCWVRAMAFLACVLVGVSSAPNMAFAHGVGGAQSTNVTTVLDRVDPMVPGVTVAVMEFGDWISVSNRTDRELRVPGYEGEPYLRIGPDGVFINRRSPAAYLNTTVTPTGPPPPETDVTAEPEWRRVSDDPSYRWHDHRAHWMAARLPEVTRQQPHAAHELMRWSIPMQIAAASGASADGATALTASGRVVWDPPSAPWVWLLCALALAAVVAIASRTRAWRAVWMGACVLTAALLMAFAVGAWQFSALDPLRRSIALVYTIAGIVISVFSVLWLARRAQVASAPLVLVTGVVLVFGTGLPGFGDLSASHLPTTLPYPLARAITSVVLGVGVGLIAGGAMFLRPSGTSRQSDAT